jgi:hypothetical protein
MAPLLISIPLSGPLRKLGVIVPSSSFEVNGLADFCQAFFALQVNHGCQAALNHLDPGLIKK